MRKPHDEVDEALDLLSLLNPQAGDEPMPAFQALARLKQHAQPATNPTPAPRAGFWSQLITEVTRMFKRKAILAPAALAIFLAAFFISPTLQAAASDFLGLFRVEKFAPITISAEQLALLEQVAQTGVTPGELEMLSEPTQPVRVESVAEAEAQFGRPVASSRMLGDPEAIYVSGGGSARLIIDLEGARAILKATGVDPQTLPDEIDGEAIDITLFNAVSQHWEGVTLLQTPSPEVSYPAGVDTVALGQALLQVLGMNEAEAARLAQEIDWTSTLVLPVPEGAASFREVTVDGHSGLGLSSLDGVHNAIIWQQDGMVYMVEGTDSLRTLNRIANSLR